jgi:hypothetical protein
MSGQQRSEGRRRLRILLAILGFAGCALGMALVVVFYGPPYNPIWWGIMAVVLGGAIALPPLLAPAIEWVMDGYRQAERG